MAETACEKAARLREIRTAIATGDAISRAGYGDKQIAYYQANMDLLEREIREADKACDIEEGRTAKRRRYAIRGRMGPY